MKFHGVVQFRSSIQPGIGPPGESEVLALNPQRLESILKATGWDRLEPGSLNLTVEAAVVNDLMKFEPTLVEDAATIRYPEQYKRIPQIRKAYYYYSATISYKQMSEPVLVRRALNPVACRVELFASINLKSGFSLSMGDSVMVEIRATFDSL
jgi:hypothetical protein